MRRLVCALSLALLVADAATAQDLVVEYDQGDRQMAAATASALDSLPLFLAHAFDPSGLPREGHLLKVAFPIQDGPAQWEHIWVASFTRTEEGHYAGLLANAPRELGDLGYLEKVEFSLGMISDWMVRSPEGLFYGAFTLRVMHGDGAFGEVPFDEVFESDLTPAEWR